MQVCGLVVFYDRLEQRHLVLFRSVLLACTSQCREKFLLTLIPLGLDEIAEGLSKRLVQDRCLIFRIFPILDKPLDIRDEFNTELSKHWIIQVIQELIKYRLTFISLISPVYLSNTPVPRGYEIVDMQVHL